VDPVHRRGLADEGFCIVEDVLDSAAVRDVRERLLRAAQESRRRGLRTRWPELDPNDANERVFNLLDLDEVFRDLIVHPLALAWVRALLGDAFRISNFTANIAHPGSGAMFLHSDLSLVAPEPWTEAGSVNVIWCLDALRAESGATRYLPRSHRFAHRAALPEDAEAHLVPFEAPAGSMLVMDGRLWHTSGENRTQSESRALLFGYYSLAGIAPQVDFAAALSDDARRALKPELARLLDLAVEPTPAANLS
jgi:ectoine hydroxylase-related dioxygenase (phytanoyl-CoA dioxygenase family)